MALVPPDEIETLDEKIKDYLNCRINELGQKYLWGVTPGMSTYYTTTSTTSTSWGGNGYYYVTTPNWESQSSSVRSTSSISFKKKEPDYIPTDNPTGKKRLEKEFMFDPNFLDLEGE